MTEREGRDGIVDAVDPATQERAAADQAEERERLEDETRARLQGDPGDPKDRLSEPEHDRLMEQATYRELHP